MYDRRVRPHRIRNTLHIGQHSHFIHTVQHFARNRALSSPADSGDGRRVSPRAWPVVYCTCATIPLPDLRARISGRVGRRAIRLVMYRRVMATGHWRCGDGRHSGGASQIYKPSSTNLRARNALTTADCGCEADHREDSLLPSIIPSRSMMASASSKSPRYPSKLAAAMSFMRARHESCSSVSRPYTVA